ncbi:MAG: RCC1 domain-containing protein [Actinomycetota bacterium]|nr:hypothetical protein [Actinomycetota bacterium]
MVVGLAVEPAESNAQPLPRISANPWGWGRGLEGQIGLYSNNSSVPVQVPTPPAHELIGGSHAGPVGLARAISVRGGSVHSIALAGDRTVWAWGSNQAGQLGNGTSDTGSNNVPTRVSGLAHVDAISAGGFHNIALQKGVVWTWGADDLGQLGHPGNAFCGGETCGTIAAPAIGLAGVTAVAAGAFHSLALLEGTVLAWGYNAQGQLGNGTTTNSAIPVPVSGLSSVTAISAKLGGSSALKSDGTVWLWGNYGNVPAQAQGLTNIIAIDGNLALRSDGTVWYGFTAAAPYQVAGLSGVQAIAFGGYANLALLPGGVVKAWGGNWYGGFGNGTTLESATPVQTSGLWQAISAGDYHSLGIALEAPSPSPAISTPSQGSTLTTNPVAVTGTATPSTTVIVSEGNTTLAQTVSDASGNWSVAVSFPNGGHSIVARAETKDQNMSDPSPTISFTMYMP